MKRRRLSLSSEGEVYFSRAQQILADVEDAEAEVARARGAPRGLLRINTSNAFGIHQLAPALPDPATHKLYFDHGSETLDAIYARYQDRVDAVVARRGYRQWSNTLSLSFPGEKHNEISWASRVAVPLQFLLPPVPAEPRKR